MSNIALELRHDPVLFVKLLWPDVKLYNKQIEIMESVRDNDETFVPAAHQMGKDFVSAATVLWFYLTRHPVRIITTSVKDDHLMVLWGEIGRFIDTCKYPLDHRKGGPLIVKHREIRKVVEGVQCKISYLKGMVSEKGEGLAGHHAPHTLLMMDECSGIDDEVYIRGCTWAKRILGIGNTYPCTNFFYRAVKEGDILDKEYI